MRRGGHAQGPALLSSSSRPSECPTRDCHRRQDPSCELAFDPESEGLVELDRFPVRHLEISSTRRMSGRVSTTSRMNVSSSRRPSPRPCASGATAIVSPVRTCEKQCSPREYAWISPTIRPLSASATRHSPFARDRVRNSFTQLSCTSSARRASPQGITATLRYRIRIAERSSSVVLRIFNRDTDSGKLIQSCFPNRGIPAHTSYALAQPPAGRCDRTD